MSNSKLVDYKLISPNKTSNRNHVIDTITIHCVACQVTVERLGEIFFQRDRNASSNYGIGQDGRIGLYVEECDRSWCSSNSANDNRAVTIEVASDNTSPYKVTEQAYEALIKLCVDICQRNNIKALKWQADKSLIGDVSKQNMTVHRWFANKACPGDYLYDKHFDIARRVNLILNNYIENPYAEPKRVIKSTFPIQRGADVKWVQYELNRKLKAKLEVDGKCGAVTVTAIKEFQRLNGLVIDGKCGPDTIKKLKKV